MCDFVRALGIHDSCASSVFCSKTWCKIQGAFSRRATGSTRSNCRGNTDVQLPRERWGRVTRKIASQFESQDKLVACCSKWCLFSVGWMTRRCTNDRVRSSTGLPPPKWRIRLCLPSKRPRYSTHTNMCNRHTHSCTHTHTHARKGNVTSERNCNLARNICPLVTLSNLQAFTQVGGLSASNTADKPASLSPVKRTLRTSTTSSSPAAKG